MIQQSVCNSYKQEVLTGVHFPGDVFKIALYTASAVLNRKTIAYISAHEVVGMGYEPGGRILEGFMAILFNDTATLSFDDVTWPVSSITARGGLIYNSSKGNKSVGVMDFGENVTSTNGPFTVLFPEQSETGALIRLR